MGIVDASLANVIVVAILAFLFASEDSKRWTIYSHVLRLWPFSAAFTAASASADAFSSRVLFSRPTSLHRIAILRITTRKAKLHYQISIFTVDLDDSECEGHVGAIRGAGC